MIYGNAPMMHTPLSSSYLVLRHFSPLSSVAATARTQPPVGLAYPGHVMFKAGDPRVEVMPEAFAIPRLTGELVSAFLRKDELGQSFQLLPGVSRG